LSPNVGLHLLNSIVFFKIFNLGFNELQSICEKSSFADFKVRRTLVAVANVFLYRLVE
jgi:hypothetical protein